MPEFTSELLVRMCVLLFFHPVGGWWWWWLEDGGKGEEGVGNDEDKRE